MIRLRVMTIILSAGLVTGGATIAEDVTPGWRAAAGSVAITPDQPVWMAGYASRDKPSEGAVHDLFAKVLIVEDRNGSRLAIATLDLIGVTPRLRQGIEAIAQSHGVPPEGLLLNASHTHCGPELRGDRLVRFGIDAEYAALSQQLERRIAEQVGRLIGETAQRLQPSRLIFSRARAGFAMNRRLPTRQGFINSPNPDGPVDHEVPVLRVVTPQGTTQAILFGYACHATTLSFQQLCGDYPGFAQQYIEEANPDAVALFLNGCSGDQNPYPRRSLELAKQHGRALANGVETALQTQLTTEITGTLGVAMRYATLLFEKPPSRAELETEAASGNQYARIHSQSLLAELDKNGEIQTEYDCFPLQAIRIGDQMTMVAICGEVVVDYSLRLKRELSRHKNDLIWVAGYSNHVFGYLPSRRVLREGGYEGRRAMQYTTFPGAFDDSVEDRVVTQVKQLVEEVRAMPNVKLGTQP